MSAEQECSGGWYDNPPETDHIDTLLMPTAEYLKTPGDGVSCPNDTCANDGMVTVQSARWGTFMGCIPADHFDEVGQIAMENPMQRADSASATSTWESSDAFATWGIDSETVQQRHAHVVDVAREPNRASAD